MLFLVIMAATVGAVGYTFLLNPNRLGTEEKRLVVFCGAASKPVMEEAAEQFERDYEINVELHFGGSGTMLSQMKIAKTGDLYIPGSHDYMLRAIEDDVVDDRTTEILAYLVPAIIVQEGNPKNIQRLEDLAKPSVRVGIGDPDSVCVGEYAVEILKHNDLYEDVKGNIVVYAESCEKTATLVTIGQVDAVIGWSVFERWNPDKVDLVLIEPNRIPKIACIPGAISAYSKDRASAQKFLSFLHSEEGQEIFRKYGYLTTIDEARTYAPVASIPQLAEHK